MMSGTRPQRVRSGCGRPWRPRPRHTSRARTVGLVMLSLTIGMLAANDPDWGSSIGAALDTAASTDQPVLLYFTATWCGPCQRMAGTTFIDPEVRQRLRQFARVKLDIDQAPEESGRRDVRAVPTFIILASTGEEVSRATGFQDARDFGPWLDRGVAAVGVAVERAARYRELLGSVTAWLQAGDGPSRRKAVDALFDLCGSKAPEHRELALEHLRRIGRDDPALLLDGVDHARLAVRIDVANLLRAQLGDEFDVDPWAGASDRRTALARWRQTLSR